ncbi:amidohydrolase family protein [Aliivibrio fischeri]
MQFARRGGYIDITSGGSQFIAPELAIKQAIESGIDPKYITVSSDGNGSLPKFDIDGNMVALTAANVDGNLLLLPKLIESGISPEIAIAMLTSNVADSLGINKGRLQLGQDADLCIFNDDFTLYGVVAKGKTVLLDNELLVTGNFE